MNLDSSSIILISINFIQVVFILFLLTPFFDIVTLSKNIKIFQNSNIFTISLATLYAITIITFGILTPTKTLTKLNVAWKRENSADNKLRNIITATNASRNYILGAFSLFFLLVTLRIFDFLDFSAKLVEFSNLMANYELLDIAFVDDNSIGLENVVKAKETIEDYDVVRWPSVIELKEENTIEHFFKVNPNKGISDLDHRKETKIIKVGEENIVDTSTISKDTLLTLVSENPKTDI
ncbi:unnamed protein product [Pieris macdunnoughi]|uniref:Uncharacterized protein n=1 Tax=Pieris macdunnoughi TaxID=345717 RepID=A0A821QQX9_9NEOP|nr:unnamed protein product [Pieris macdunnoughi]